MCTRIFHRKQREKKEKEKFNCEIDLVWCNILHFFLLSLFSMVFVSFSCITITKSLLSCLMICCCLPFIVLPHSFSHSCSHWFIVRITGSHHGNTAEMGSNRRRGKDLYFPSFIIAITFRMPFPFHTDIYIIPFIFWASFHLIHSSISYCMMRNDCLLRSESETPALSLFFFHPVDP